MIRIIFFRKTFQQKNTLNLSHVSNLHTGGCESWIEAMTN